MILFSVFVFKQPLTMMSCVGCLITFLGSIWYFYGMCFNDMKRFAYIEKSIDEEGDNIIQTDNEVSERQSLI